MGTLSLISPLRSAPAPAPAGRRSARRRAAEARALARVYARGDRYMGVLVALHLALAAVLAPAHGTWRVSAAVAAAAAATFYAVRALRPASFVARATAGLALQTFCALHIHQLNGLAEMHFFYFTSVTAMILYKDWRALWPGVLAIIAQHTVFAVGHNLGWHPGGQTFFEHHHVPPLNLAFHFGIALVQAAIASVIADALRTRTLADAAQQRRLRRANAVLAAQGVELEERAVERARLFAAEADARSRAERARGEAERANAAKSQFLATMSHELRTPLNAIAGHVQLVELGLHGPVTPAQHEALARVQRAQRHLLGLIDDVLDYAKLEAGRVVFRLAPVPAVDALADLAPMIEPQLAAKRLAYAVDVPAGAAVRADRERLAQVLLNLLSNAAKFTPAGGAVSVRVRVAPGAGAADARVTIAVRDTGVGIPPDKLATIFEPFVQVEQGLTRPHEGTGLGLSISRELARGMGGDLTATSTPGAGSTFTLVLPAAAAAAPAAARAA
jgi:signal transduction histidine kinase